MAAKVSEPSLPKRTRAIVREGCMPGNTSEFSLGWGKARAELRRCNPARIWPLPKLGEPRDATRLAHSLGRTGRDRTIAVDRGRVDHVAR